MMCESIGYYAQLFHDVRNMRKRIHSINRTTLNPRSKNIARWDLVTIGALFFTALVTPVEVAFIQPPTDRWSDALWLTQRERASDEDLSQRSYEHSMLVDGSRKERATLRI